MGSQSALIKDVNKAGRGRVNALKGQSDSVKSLTKSIQEAKIASRGFTDELKQGLRDAKEETGGLRGALGGVKDFMFSWKGGVLAIFGGIGAAIAKLGTSIVSVFKGAFSLIQSIVKGAMGIVKATIMAPFKMMGALTDAANKIREIQVVINGAVQSAKGMIGNFREVGSTTQKAFGVALDAVKKLPRGLYSAREHGTAEMIQDAAELSKNFAAFQEELKGLSKNGARSAIALQKAFSYTAEDFKAMVIATRSSGKSLDDEMQDSLKSIDKLKEATGSTSKHAGEQFKQFYVTMKFQTQATRSEIEQTAIKFTKLGMTAENAMSMVAKFDTLESGAETVSGIARNFGVFIDQNEMLMAQDDPGKMLSLYQKKFAESGVFFEDMSRQRRQQLQQLTGITDPMTLAAVFGEGGEDAIEKALKKAKADKKARDMPTLLKRINASIKGVADSMGRLMKPLEAFMDGFTRGMAAATGKDVTKGAHDIQESMRAMGKDVGFLVGKSGVIQGMVDMLKNFTDKMTKIIPDITELFRVLFGKKQAGDRDAMTILGDIGEKLFGAYKPIVNKGVQFIADIITALAPFVIQAFAALGDMANDAMFAFLQPGKSGNLGKYMQDKISGLANNDYFDKDTSDAIKKTGKTIGDSWTKNFGEGSKKMRQVFDGKEMKPKMASLGEALTENFIGSLKKLGGILADVLADVLVAALSDWRVVAAFALLMNPMGSLRLLGKGAQFLGRGIASAGRGAANFFRGARGARAANVARAGKPRGFRPYKWASGGGAGQTTRMGQLGASAYQKGARASQAVGQFAARTMPTLTRAAGASANIVAKSAKGIASVTGQVGRGVGMALRSTVGTTNAVSRSASLLTRGAGAVASKLGAAGMIYTVGSGVAAGINEVIEGKGSLQAWKKGSEALGNQFLSGVSLGLIDENMTKDMQDSFYDSLLWISGEETEKEIERQMKAVRDKMVKEIKLHNQEVAQAREGAQKLIKAQSVQDLKDLIKQDRMGLIDLTDDQIATYKKLIGQQDSVQDAMAAARHKVEREASRIQQTMTKMGNVISEAEGKGGDGEGYLKAEDYKLQYAGDLMNKRFLSSSAGANFIENLLKNMQDSDQISGSEMKKARAAVYAFQRSGTHANANELKRVIMDVLDGKVNSDGSVEFDDDAEMPIFFEAVIKAKAQAAARKKAKLDSMDAAVAKAQQEAMGATVKWTEKELKSAIEVFGKESEKGKQYLEALKKKRMAAEIKAINVLIGMAMKSGDEKEFLRLTGKTFEQAIKDGQIVDARNSGRGNRYEQRLGAYTDLNAIRGSGTSLGEDAVKFRAKHLGDKFILGDQGDAMQKELNKKKGDVADAAAKKGQAEARAFKVFMADVIKIYKKHDHRAMPTEAQLKKAYEMISKGETNVAPYLPGISMGASDDVVRAGRGAAVKAEQQAAEKDPNKAAKKGAKAKAAGTVKKGKSKVKAKPLKGTKDLAKLDQKTLRLLSNKWSVKNIRIRGGKITEMLDKLGPAAEKVAGALQGKAGPAMTDISVKSAEATANLALTVIELDKVHDRMAAVAASLSGMVTSITRIKSESNGFLGKDKIQITGEDGTSLTVNLNVTMDAKTLATGLEKTGLLRFK